nr:polysaccharide pyruvyl transferase family protein [Oricola indica]
MTHHWVPNFGANLQALGTKRLLEARGYDVDFVDFRPRGLVEKYRESIPHAQQEAHRLFVEDNLPQTKPIEDQAGFERLVRATPADLFVTGSDAVFRLNPASSRADLIFPNPYWLTGIPDGPGTAPKRVALAPSAMGSNLSRMDAVSRQGMARALRAMDGISVRDAWTLRQIRRIAPNITPEIVPDPVFSLRKTMRAARHVSPAVQPYVVVNTMQIMDRAWIREFSQFAQADGYQTISIPTPEGVIDEGALASASLPISPIQWLELLSRSSGYLGVRFHPVVVTLSVGQPVVSLDLYHGTALNAGRSKTWLIMKEFGLTSVCHGHRSHKSLSPRHVWAEIQRQRKQMPEKTEVADRLGKNIETYLDRVLYEPVT